MADYRIVHSFHFNRSYRGRSRYYLDSHATLSSDWKVIVMALLVRPRE